MWKNAECHSFYFGSASMPCSRVPYKVVEVCLFERSPSQRKQKKLKFDRPSSLGTKAFSSFVLAIFASLLDSSGISVQRGRSHDNEESSIAHGQIQRELRPAFFPSFSTVEIASSSVMEGVDRTVNFFSAALTSTVASL